MKILKNLFKRKYPKYIKKLWICWECAKFNRNTKYNTDFSKNGLDKGRLVPLFKDDRWLYFYEILSVRWNGSGSDLAMWDNGREYDLKYHHTEKVVNTTTRLTMIKN